MPTSAVLFPPVNCCRINENKFLLLLQAVLEFYIDLNLLSHYCSDDIGDKEVRVLGAVKAHILTDKERELIGAGIDEDSIKKCHRVQNRVGILYCEDYHRTQNRNSFSIMYSDGQTRKFGSVKYYLKTPNNLLALVNRFQMRQKTHLNFDVKNPELKRYRNVNLCPQYNQLSERQREQLELVPVKNITAKCVFIACQKNKKLVSVPPNMLEHS